MEKLNSELKGLREQENDIDLQLLKKLVVDAEFQKIIEDCFCLPNRQVPSLIGCIRPLLRLSAKCESFASPHPPSANADALVAT